jgi:hypothetical protein
MRSVQSAFSPKQRRTAMPDMDPREREAMGDLECECAAQYAGQVLEGHELGCPWRTVEDENDQTLNLRLRAERAEQQAQKLREALKHYVVCIRGEGSTDVIVGPFYKRETAQEYRDSVQAVLNEEGRDESLWIEPIYPAKMMAPRNKYYACQPWDMVGGKNGDENDG